MLTEKAVSAQIFRREAERDFLLERVGVDGDGASRDEIFAAIEIQRHGSALHARGLDREIDLEFAAAKSELRRAELGDAHVGKTFGVADADRKYRHRQRRRAIDRLSLTVGDAVAENDDAGLRAALSRATCCSNSTSRVPGSCGFRPRQAARRDGFQAGAEANHAKIVIAIEFLDQRRLGRLRVFSNEIEPALRRFVACARSWRSREIPCFARCR